MLRSLLKKDIKLIFTNKTNFALLLVLPIMLILVFGFALDNYMSGNYNTFDDGKILYYEEDPSEEMQSKFAEISQLITQKTGVIFEEINNYEEAKRKVEKSEAFAVVKITGDIFTTLDHRLTSLRVEKLCDHYFLNCLQAYQKQMYM